MSTAEILDELFNDSLESLALPDVYIRLRELMESETASMADAAEVLSLDAALAARVLQMANSAFYGFRSQVDTITRAANILGMQKIHDLALAAGVSSAVEGLTNPVMDLSTFWYRSLHCGFLARELASRAGLSNIENVFVRGLIHDIGHLLLFSHYPEASRQAMAHADQGMQSRLQAERELIGIDALQLVSKLSQVWQLPDSFVLTFSHLMHPENIEGPLAHEAAILHVALQITHGIDADLLLEDIFEQVDPAVWDLAGLSPGDITATLDASSVEMVEAMYRVLTPQEEAA